MDNKFFNLALIGILFSINACAPSKNIITANPLPDWWDTREITVSHMTYIRPGPYMIINYDYFVNEIKYQGSFAPPSGDYSYSYDINYEIAYNPNNPKEHFLLEYRRVIDYEKLDGVTLTRVTASKYITLRKKRPELLINGMTARALFGADHKKIKVLTLGHQTSPSNDLGTLSFFIEHHDTMLYYQNFQHKVYLMSYDKSNPINSLLHYEYPVGLEKYSWTRMMHGKVTNSKLLKNTSFSTIAYSSKGHEEEFYYGFQLANQIWSWISQQLFEGLSKGAMYPDVGEWAKKNFPNPVDSPKQKVSIEIEHESIHIPLGESCKSECYDGDQDINE